MPSNSVPYKQKRLFVPPGRVTRLATTLRPFSIAVALPARAERALKSAHAGVTGAKNNERFARAGKANVNGKRPLVSLKRG